MNLQSRVGLIGKQISPTVIGTVSFGPFIPETKLKNLHIYSTYQNAPFPTIAQTTTIQICFCHDDVLDAAMQQLGKQLLPLGFILPHDETGRLNSYVLPLDYITTEKDRFLGITVTVPFLSRFSFFLEQVFS